MSRPDVFVSYARQLLDQEGTWATFILRSGAAFTVTSFVDRTNIDDQINCTCSDGMEILIDRTEVVAVKEVEQPGL